MGIVRFWRWVDDIEDPTLTPRRIHDLELEIISQVGTHLALLSSDEARCRVLQYWAERLELGHKIEPYDWGEDERTGQPTGGAA